MSKMHPFLIGKIEASMAAVRQCKTAQDKLSFMALMLPQQVKDGKLLNFRGDVLGTFEAEDIELCPVERLTEATRLTDALMNEVFNPIGKLLGPASEQAAALEETDIDVGDETDIDVGDETDIEPEAKVDDKAVAKIKKAIEKGKLDKAKELLKELGKDHPEHKALKKSIKKAGKE